MSEFETIFQKEEKNKYHIYLYYTEEGGGEWKAYGYSAFYLSFVYPSLQVITEYDPFHGIHIAVMSLPVSCLLEISETCRTLAGDDFIRLDAPPIAYAHREDYCKWSENLFEKSGSVSGDMVIKAGL